MRVDPEEVAPVGLCQTNKPIFDGAKFIADAPMLRQDRPSLLMSALADWFAVTALFRHPLGIPIPHTAIVPRNKERIGDQLAQFLRENFLITSVIARRMQGLDVAGAIARWLTDPPESAGASRLDGDPPRPRGPEWCHRRCRERVAQTRPPAGTRSSSG